MPRQRTFAPRTSCLSLIASSVGVAAVMFMAPGSAAASEEIELEISIKDHKFDPPQLKIPADKHVKLSVKNLDASPEEFESNELGIEKVIPGNSSATIRLKPMKPGTYLFFGEFHESTAQGHIQVD